MENIFAWYFWLQNKTKHDIDQIFPFLFTAKTNCRLLKQLKLWNYSCLFSLCQLAVVFFVAATHLLASVMKEGEGEKCECFFSPLSPCQQLQFLEIGMLVSPPPLSCSQWDRWPEPPSRPPLTFFKCGVAPPGSCHLSHCALKKIVVLFQWGIHWSTMSV